MRLCVCERHSQSLSVPYFVTRSSQIRQILNKSAKITWLRSLLFCRLISIDQQGQIWIKSLKYTILNFYSRQNFRIWTKCILALLRSLLILGLIDLDLHFHFYCKTYFLPNTASLIYLRCVLYTFSETFTGLPITFHIVFFFWGDLKASIGQPIDLALTEN